tara:strand:+ start:25 stop:516 length:492 start_codon:yes stop_codon:yes gene_type:complete
MSYHYTYDSTDFSKEDLIQFYKHQYLMLTRTGVGGLTKFNVEVTEKLIKCTANRLDQLIRGKKTVDNMCYAEKLIKMWGRDIGDFSSQEKSIPNSNRSFIGNITSKFDIKDLGKTNELSIVRHTDYIYVSEKHRRSIEHTVYIDNISTAYNSEIVTAILSHDN